MLAEHGESGTLVPEGGGSFAPEIARRLSGLLAAGLVCAETDGRVRLTVKGALALRGR